MMLKRRGVAAGLPVPLNQHTGDEPGSEDDIVIDLCISETFTKFTFDVGLVESCRLIKFTSDIAAI